MIYVLLICHGLVARTNFFTYRLKSRYFRFVPNPLQLMSPWNIFFPPRLIDLLTIISFRLRFLESMPLETIQQSEPCSNKKALNTMAFASHNSLSSFPDELLTFMRGFLQYYYKVFLSGSKKSLSARGSVCFTLRSKELLIYLCFWGSTSLSIHWLQLKNTQTKRHSCCVIQFATPEDTELKDWPCSNSVQPDTVSTVAQIRISNDSSAEKCLYAIIQSVMRKIPKECRFHLRRDGSLK
jgi:hypothetical protein